MTRAAWPERGVVAFEAIALPSGEQIRRSLSGSAGPVPEQAGAQAPLDLALQVPAGRVGTVGRQDRCEGEMVFGGITLPGPCAPCGGSSSTTSSVTRA
jgi:hypothetical protein